MQQEFRKYVNKQEIALFSRDSLSAPFGQHIPIKKVGINKKGSLLRDPLVSFNHTIQTTYYCQARLLVYVSPLQSKRLSLKIR